MEYIILIPFVLSILAIVIKVFRPIRKPLKTLSIDQIKSVAKIIIIDDNKPTEIIDNLKREGWKVNYLEDLDALGNKYLLSSHIVCIDIMDVGKKLGLDNGMQLAKEIKNKYPEKKVVLYSTVSKQDIFDDTLDIVDKRLKKIGSPLPFTSAIEELAIKSLNFEDAVKYAYTKVLPLIKGDITYDQFRSAALKNSGKSFDLEKFALCLKISSSAASMVGSMLKFAIAGVVENENVG